VNRNQNVMGKVVYLLVEKKGRWKPLVKLALVSDGENVQGNVEVRHCEAVKGVYRKWGKLRMPLGCVVVSGKMIEED
jgi:hypothetical protein